MYRLLFILSLLLFIFSCRPSSTPTIWDERFQDERYTLNAIAFEDDLHAYAVGGATWFEGICVHTSDGGETWQLDSLSNKELFDIDFDASGKGYIVGIDGYLYTKEPQQQDWTFHRLHRWDLHRGVDFFDSSRGVIVSGIAYQMGVTQQYNERLESVVQTEFEQELQAVCYSDSSTVYAVGFGQVLRSADSGKSWTRLDILGDFFQDICFPSPEVGYIVGRAGTMLKTTDGGLSWFSLEKGNRLFRSNPAFRALYFINEQTGYVAGENGLLWRTSNGGVDWSVYADAPDIDFLDVFATDQVGFVVGEFASIFRFDVQ